MDLKTKRSRQYSRARFVQLALRNGGALVLSRSVARAAPELWNEILQNVQRDVLGAPCAVIRARRYSNKAAPLRNGTPSFLKSAVWGSAHSGVEVSAFRIPELIYTRTG
jgi:hypothetical protein